MHWTTIESASKSSVSSGVGFLPKFLLKRLSPLEGRWDIAVIIAASSLLAVELRAYYHWRLLVETVVAHSDRSELAAGSIDRLEVLLARTDPAHAVPLR